jgi:hypothetical protein
LSGVIVASIKDLLKANLVSSGTQLIWKRRKLGQTYTALINADSTITTGDGIIHKSPSGAAKHLNGNKPVDGWMAWKIKGTGQTLSELRNNLN